MTNNIDWDNIDIIKFGISTKGNLFIEFKEKEKKEESVVYDN